MAMDLERLKQKKARRTSIGWTPKEGDNLIRVLPHTSRYFSASLEDFAHEFRSHFLRAEGMETQVVRCLRDRKETCAICEAAKKFKDSPDVALKKAAEQIRGGERHLMNIINLNDIQAGVQAFETGSMIYEGILDFAANPAWGDLFDPRAGRDITLVLTPGNRTKSGYNDYSVQPHPKQTDITPHLPADWMQKLDELESMMPSYPEPDTINKWLTLLGMGGTPPAAAPIQPPPTVPVAPQPVLGTPVAPAVPAPPMPAPMPPAVPAPIPPAAPVPVAPPVVPPAPAPTAAPSPVPTAPAPVVAAPVAPPVYIFAAQHGLSVVAKPPRPEVPHCFSEGPTNPDGTPKTDIGFNPQRWPCEKGCPVRADCQLKQLGLHQ